eukprot:gene15300-636_t
MHSRGRRRMHTALMPMSPPPLKVSPTGPIQANAVEPIQTQTVQPTHQVVMSSNQPAVLPSPVQ